MKIPVMLAILATALPLLSQGRTEVVPTRDEPVVAVEVKPGHWFFDFGKTLFGNVELSGQGIPKGKVTVHLGETVSGEHEINRRPGGTIRYQSHEVTLDPRRAVSPELVWKAPGWLKSGFLTPQKGCGEIMPFRYVELENAPDGFSAKHIRRISWTVPFDDDAASFNSSSPELDGVYDLCKHSMKATSAFGVYIDGDRERRPYEADILINQLSHYAVDAHYETARHSLDFIIERPTWPTEWHLQTPMIAWNDFLWSGDDSRIRRHYKTLVERAHLERRTEEGLFLGFSNGDPKDIIDWPEGERDGFVMDWEIKSPVTAFHYRALLDLAKIARHLGKRSDADKFAKLAEETFTAFNQYFWEEDKGCYADGANPSDAALPRSTHASAHANFFPLALGLVPADRMDRVADYLARKGMACSVYGAQFLLEGLYQAGRGDDAMKLLTASDNRSWRHMSETLGATITLEAWDPSFKPNLDFNHAWGAAPGNIIPRCLTGIEPLEPAFKRFAVRPQTADLEHAEVKLPTIKGPITLRIDRQEHWSAELTVPNGCTAEFQLPEIPYQTVEINGSAREVPAQGQLELPPGKHTIRLLP